MAMNGAEWRRQQAAKGAADARAGVELLPFTGNVTRQAVMGKANEWVGIREDSGNNDCWFSRDWGIVGQSWCVAFCQSCFYYADVSPDGKLPHQSMFVPYVVAWARANGQALEWEQVDQVQAGDMIMFTWDTVNWPRFEPGTGDHIGIVEWTDGYNITTIEGNTRPPGVGGYDGVFRRTDRTLDQVVCFWRPTVYTATVEEDVTTPDQMNQILGAIAEVNTRCGWLLNDTKTQTGLQVGPAVGNLAIQLRQQTRVRLIEMPNGGWWICDLIGVIPIHTADSFHALDGVGYFNNDRDANGAIIPQKWSQEAFDQMVRYDLPPEIDIPVDKLPAVVDVAASLRMATVDQLADLGAAKLMQAVEVLLARSAS